LRRRDFLKALPAAGVISAAPAATGVPALTGARIKIIDIRLVRLRVLKDVGRFAGFMGPQDLRTVRVGGGSFIEVHTDQQGLIGSVPASTRHSYPLCGQSS
jgi:hypothetical protein